MNKIEIKSELIGIKGLAVLLNVSETSIRRLDRTGKIPLVLKIGRSKKWSISEVREWLEEGCPTRQIWLNVKSSRNY